MDSLLHYLFKEHDAVETYKAACEKIDANSKLLEDPALTDEERNRIKAYTLDAMLTKESTCPEIERIRHDIRHVLSDYLREEV